MMEVELYAPPDYWALTDDERACYNGCGTSGWKGAVVPETMWGLNVTRACNIHDHMYKYGMSEEDRAEADRVFLNNLMRIINARGGWLTWLRRYRAVTYYNFVRKYGSVHFWDGKNKPENMVTVTV